MNRIRVRWREKWRTRGFTLIELLIVILIIAVLMAVALPLYLGTMTHSETTVCRSNMQSIANAEQAYRARDTAHQYTTDLTKLPVDLGAIPVCPQGGSYTVTISDGTATTSHGNAVPAGGILVHCSVFSHGDFAPSIDSE